jgi:cytochrome c oxidase subunit III
MASTTYPPRGPAANSGVAIPVSDVGARTAPQMAAIQTGTWVGVCAIFMCFAALVSALVVREGSSTDWRHLVLPRVLYFNTLILLASSYTLELCRERFAAAVRPEAGPGATPELSPLPWLYRTILLGTIFVIGQFFAWRTLASNGVFLATNPSSSFFYVLTAMHGLHLLGGMAGLSFMARRLARGVTRTQAGALGAMAVYWHFMGLLWIFLFLVMAIRL